MKGNDDVVDEDLYKGTAKSIGGCLADECYDKATKEGCKIEVVWQDADSSSAQPVYISTNLKLEFSNVGDMLAGLITTNLKL